MFTAALFITAKIWKQPKHSSMGEEIYIHTLAHTHTHCVLSLI